MKRPVILLISLLAAVNAWAWGPKGHDVTAYIAECNLTPEAAERIDRLLGGYSIVYFANWLDTASHTPEYAYSRTWHYANIDDGYTFETMPRNPDGDVVSAVEMLTDALRKGGLESEQEALYLKMLVHLVGDLHCPMHSGRLTDVGGNTLPVRMFGHDTNLHSVWDSSLPEAAHKWSYTEWQSQIDRLADDEAVLMEAGDPLDWYLEAHAICEQIYADTPPGTNISYDYVAKYTPVIERQFLRGGRRLARLLNEIYR